MSSAFGVSAGSGGERRKSKGKEKAKKDKAKKSKKSKKSIEHAAGGVSSRGGDAGPAVAASEDGLSDAYSLITQAEKLVLVRVPSAVDPRTLHGAQVSLNSVSELGDGLLQAHPQEIRSTTAGAGRPVVVARSAPNAPLLVAGGFDYHLTITEALSLTEATMSDADIKAAKDAARIKQLDNLDFRYVPFGAAADPAQSGAHGPSRTDPPQKRKRKERDGDSGGGAADKKARKKKKKAAKDKA